MPSTQYRSTKQAGYGYPGKLSWAPVALPRLLSGLEPHLTPPGPPRTTAGLVPAGLRPSGARGSLEEALLEGVEATGQLLTSRVSYYNENTFRSRVLPIKK